jgi:hypothetical protein
MLLATAAVLLCGADSYLYSGADRPKGPPDIYLTCQVEQVIQGDGRLLTDFAEPPTGHTRRRTNSAGRSAWRGYL